METTARVYFEKFADATFLKNLPSAQVKAFEDEWLDFKSGKPQEGDIARIWSKALGAFANNEGGVLVWGIKAEKDPVTKIDAASALDLVPNVELLKSKLVEQFRLATDPPILGVEIVALPSSEIGKEGFVVCYIPEGLTKPYKSLRADKPFYLRMGRRGKRAIVINLKATILPALFPSTANYDKP